MPRELDNKLAIAECERTGWHCWFPRRVWGERDIFGVFDFIAAKDGRTMLVQVTTIQHLSDRRKKVQAFYDRIGFSLNNAYVWAYDPKKNRWVKEKII